MTRTRYDEAEPFTTKDGSTIRELIHPDRHGPGRQSLAEARVAVGGHTRRHLHRVSEEIYHITAGRGRMLLGRERFEVEAGDSVRIPPGMVHAIENIGEEELVLLCLCSPPYSDGDTVLVE